MNDLHWLTIKEASEEIHSGTLSPVEYTQALISRTEQLDPNFCQENFRDYFYKAW